MPLALDASFAEGPAERPDRVVHRRIRDAPERGFACVPRAVVLGSVLPERHRYLPWSGLQKSAVCSAPSGHGHCHARLREALQDQDRAAQLPPVTRGERAPGASPDIATHRTGDLEEQLGPELVHEIFLGARAGQGSQGVVDQPLDHPLEDGLAGLPGSVVLGSVVPGCHAPHPPLDTRARRIVSVGSVVRRQVLQPMIIVSRSSFPVRNRSRSKRVKSSSGVPVTIHAAIRSATAGAIMKP